MQQLVHVIVNKEGERLVSAMRSSQAEERDAEPERPDLPRRARARSEPTRGSSGVRADASDTCSRMMAALTAMSISSSRCVLTCSPWS